MIFIIGKLYKDNKEVDEEKEKRNNMFPFKDGHLFGEN